MADACAYDREYRPYLRRLQSGASIPVAANIQAEGSGAAEVVNCPLTIEDICNEQGPGGWHCRTAGDSRRRIEQACLAAHG